MDNPELNAVGGPAPQKPVKPRRSFIGKAFWGLIGLMAVVAGGLIAMAVVSMNKYTYADANTAKPKEPSVEIIDLAGNSRIVNANMVPANPAGTDESAVEAGTNPSAKALASTKESGTALVEQVAVKPVTTPKKQQVAVAEVKNQAEAPTPAKGGEKSKPVKAESVKIQKEANKQMDNLF